MSGYRDLELVFNYIELEAKIVGFNVFVPEYKLNFISYLVLLDILSYNIVSISNVIEYWGDLIQVCFCLITFSFGIQGLARIVVFFKHSDCFRKLKFQMIDFAREMEKRPEVTDIVKKYCRYAKYHSAVLSSLFWTCTVLGYMYPYPVMKLTGEVILPFGFVLPSLDYTRNPGYFVNYCYQVVQGVLTITGLTMVQCVWLCFVLYGCMILEIIVRKLSIMQEHLESGDVMMKNQSQLVEIIDLIELHQKFMRFIENIETMFSVMFLIDATSITFQMAITVFVCSIEIWIIGCMVILIVTFMLFIVCAYGVFLEYKYDDLEQAIYDIPWHLLPIKERKMVIFMLHISQNPTFLTFGNMAPVNMASFVSIYKSIYSFVMFLERSQNK